MNYKQGGIPPVGVSEILLGGFFLLGERKLTVCIGVSTIPPVKNTAPLSCQAPPPLNRPTVQAPLFRQSPLYIGFLLVALLKVGFFSEPKILKFFILNTILSFKSN